jgi:LPS-assembly protein
MPPVVPPFARVFLSLCLTAACLEAFADTSVQLKSSGQLSPASPAGKPAPGPTHVEADQIEGHDNLEMIAQGKVIMRNLREQVEADWLRYDQDTDLAQARGNVVLTRERDRLEGSALKLKLEDRLGDMQDVRFQVYSKNAKTPLSTPQLSRGEAKTLTFEGPDVYRMDAASYTSCPIGNDDWLLKMDELQLDYVNSLGSARQVRVEYLNVPILYTPWMDFALDDKRKSGLLSPTYGASNSRGLEIVVPWYWNIAPNYDATITPREMSKRGLQLGSEFRYLEPKYSGDLSAEWLPNDHVTDTDRYRVYWRHRQNFDAKWSGSVEYEKVSDNTYFADLSSLVNQTSRVNLPHQVNLNYNAGWWQASGMAQSFQTLQDPAAPVVAPYQRMPQITLTAAHDHVFDSVIRGGAHFDLNSELVYFDHPGANMVQGARLNANPSLSFPVQTPYSVVTPKLGWYLTRYSLDDTTRNLSDSIAAAPAAGFADTTRSLPMFSLDSRLFLERDMSFRGDNYTQTLEPRAYYVYIPYRNQSRIPVFDSSLRDLSMDQLFAENQYIGVDRINDANQLTLAVTSRFLAQNSGAERLQVTLGQRYYFSEQQVTLPGESVRASNSSELLAQVSGQVNAKLRLTGGVQYDPGAGNLTQANFGGAWRDGPGRLFNADYRYTQSTLAQVGLNQIDLSAQWPLAPKWYGLGRLNYSFRDTRLVEGLAGFEYNAGCWSVRAVLQKLATTETTATSAFFLQLELRGLTKLGPNPLDVLKRSITGYAQSSEIPQ